MPRRRGLNVLAFRPECSGLPKPGFKICGRARASPSAKSVACRATDAGQTDAALHLCGLLAHRGGWARGTAARARLRVKVDTRHMRAMRRGASLLRACTVARWPECAAADICDPADSVMSGSTTSLLVRQRKRSAARLLASCRTRRLRLPLPQKPDKRVTSTSGMGCSVPADVPRATMAVLTGSLSACEGADENSWQSRPGHARASNEVLLKSSRRSRPSRNASLHRNGSMQRSDHCRNFLLLRSRPEVP